MAWNRGQMVRGSSPLQLITVSKSQHVTAKPRHSQRYYKKAFPKAECSHKVYFQPRPGRSPQSPYPKSTPSLPCHPDLESPLHPLRHSIWVQIQCPISAPSPGSVTLSMWSLDNSPNPHASSFFPSVLVVTEVKSTESYTDPANTCHFHHCQN